MVEGQPLYGGRLLDIDGLHWRGDESGGHFEDEKGRWVDLVHSKAEPPRVHLIDEPPPFYPIIPFSLR